jgi:hypothetical protein
MNYYCYVKENIVAYNDDLWLLQAWSFKYLRITYDAIGWRNTIKE